jgi:hypothetical protein
MGKYSFNSNLLTKVTNCSNWSQFYFNWKLNLLLKIDSLITRKILISQLLQYTVTRYRCYHSYEAD